MTSKLKPKGENHLMRTKVGEPRKNIQIEASSHARTHIWRLGGHRQLPELAAEHRKRRGEQQLDYDRAYKPH